MSLFNGYLSSNLSKNSKLLGYLLQELEFLTFLNECYMIEIVLWAIKSLQKHAQSAKIDPQVIKVIYTLVR